MKFSIVITTYNRLALLRRAVESALAQTYPCEVVVADDCSSDGTEEYIRSLGDRVIYNRSAANSGSHAVPVNAGVGVAQGDWIKLLDDDDYLAPNCIEEMVKAITQRPQAVICSCQAIQVDANGVEVSRTQPSGPGELFYVPQEDIHYGMMLEVVPFGTPIQVAFSREAFLKSGGWDSALDVCDDIDSWIKIAQYGDAIFLNKYLTYRTLWPGSNNQKSSLQNRLEQNILMKERIYPLVSEKHRSSLPTLEDIRAYLRLHWSLVGLKQKKVSTSIKMAYPAVFSIAGWAFLARVINSRKLTQKASVIRQEVIDTEKPHMPSEASSTK